MPISTLDDQLALHHLQHPDVIADPTAYYTALRTTAPVHYDPYLRSWLLSRYADVEHVLLSPYTSVHMAHTATLPQFAGLGLEEIFGLLDLHVSFVDGPDHRRLRRSLAEPIQVRHVRTHLAAAIDAAVAATFAATFADGIRPGPVDLVDALAVPVPVRVVQHLLQLHDVDIDTVQRWSHAWGDIIAAPGHVPTGDRDTLLRTVAEAVDHLRALAARLSRAATEAPAPGMGGESDTAAPGAERSSMFQALVAAEQEGALSREELIANALMLVTAGTETSANLIGNAAMALADDPALWRVARTEPDRVPALVDEVGRLHPPTQHTARRTTADITLPSGPTIPAGASVVLLLAAANRDPAAYPDPDQVILDRSGPAPLTFGHGPHRCFGAPLAHAETTATLHRLAERVLHMTPLPGRIWRRNGTLRGLATLPIRLHLASAR